ncbi:transposase, partial [Ferrimicrobium acidiphilum]|uniref:transposase n=1 Tax=Ferrimicrobium acidiphilum TaxID=121039 RepID=UPI0023EFAA83
MKALLYEICPLDALTVNGVRYSFLSADGSNSASLVNGVTSKQHRPPESPWIVLADGSLAPQMERKSTGSVVGIDMGIAITVATSEGKSLKAPKLLTKGQRQRRRRLQRKLNRQVKGSNRYKATKLAIAKLAAKEVDRRKDWIEWTTTDLVRDYDLISLETLKIKNMTKSAKGTKDKPGKNVKAKPGLNRS